MALTSLFYMCLSRENDEFARFCPLGGMLNIYLVSNSPNLKNTNRPISSCLRVLNRRIWFLMMPHILEFLRNVRLEELAALSRQPRYQKQSSSNCLLGIP